MSNDPTPEPMRRRWHEQFEVARTVVEASDDVPVRELGSTLVMEALFAFNFWSNWCQGSQRESALPGPRMQLGRVFLEMARRRLDQVLACPGCVAPAAYCPEHGRVGDWLEWSNDLATERFRRLDAPLPQGEGEER